MSRGHLRRTWAMALHVKGMKSEPCSKEIDLKTTSLDSSGSVVECITSGERYGRKAASTSVALRETVRRGILA
eukprot:844293-Alexandrium_andersonii.AAC.1